jgi:peptidyl-prolyl cis-trans isomerase C
MFTFLFSGRAPLALLSSAAFLASSVFIAHAQEEKVLARVNEITITQKDIDIAAEDLADRLPQGLQEAQKRDYLVGYVIDLKIGAKAAEDAKMGEGGDFAKRLTYFREKILLDEYLSRASKKAVNLESAKKLYDETTKSLKPEEEVRARHILVEQEEEAQKVFARVKGGEDFAKVALEVSKDPGSGKTGGDLGYFSRDRMVKPFADAAFGAEKGALVAPVKSQFGWHIIKVEDKRTKPVPGFEEVRPQIDMYLGRKAQQDAILALREGAKIERLDKTEEDAKDGAKETPAADKKVPAKP